MNSRYIIAIPKLIFIYFLFISVVGNISAQSIQDTLKIKNLGEINVIGYHLKVTEIEALPDINGTYLISGKKNEVIQLANQNSNISEKTARQIFSKIPGVFVYDMDGSGNQINIATRGLDPHRSWEYNIRQNDVMINSDLYGYPASHYSFPLESIDKIELIRGTASLQYGGQFGGMINYKIKQAPSNKDFELESINTVGSFGLISSFNSISGSFKKWKYYIYEANRHSEGYRKNSESNYNAQYININYAANEKLLLTAELGRSIYSYHIPGPLNDSMFNANPKTSTRSRNYFSPEIWVPSLKLYYNINKNTSIDWITSAVLGNRNSVQVTGNAISPDVINTNFGGRQVDIDGFHSYTSEFRLIHHYELAKLKSCLATGIRLINNDLHRQQLGVGTSESNEDYSVKDNIFKRDLHFKTQNIAVYVENLFQLTDNWIISPGIRFESGHSDVSGTITYLNENDIPNKITHSFLLGGISSKYKLSTHNVLHAGFSQAYRPVVFKDIIPETNQEGSSKDLKDVTGYNAEIGINGRIIPTIKFDLTLFRLQQNNRMGSVTIPDINGKDSLYFRTNIGNSLTDGIEFYIQWNLFENSNTNITLFNSSTYMNGRYTNGEMRDANDKNINKSLKGNKVEAIPEVISRSGLDIGYKKFSFSILFSYTGQSFADPFNTVNPNKSGTIGLVPSYGLFDTGVSYFASKNIKLKLNVNNLFNKQYFTKRPTFYPGPGIWSSDGRGFQISFQVKL